MLESQLREILGDRPIDQCLIDSGWHPESVYAFLPEACIEFKPAKGYGVGQQRMRPYSQPKSTGATITKIGEGWHACRLTSPRVQLVEVDVDHWKSWLHARLRTPKGDPGSFKLFKVNNANEHLSFAKHLVSERQVEEFDPRKGKIVRWELVQRANHWLDAAMLACVAGNIAGVRLIGGSHSARPKKPRSLNDWFNGQKNAFSKIY